MERRGLLEMLISCDEKECELQGIALFSRVSVSPSVYACERVLVSSLVSVCVSLEADPVSPFYNRREAQGHYMRLLRGGS